MSRQLTTEQMQLAQMQLQYEVAKLQQKTQEITALGSIGSALISDPVQMSKNLIDNMSAWDTFMQCERKISISYWED